MLAVMFVRSSLSTDESAPTVSIDETVSATVFAYAITAGLICLAAISIIVLASIRTLFV